MACEKLVEYVRDKNDLELLDAEIKELKLMLDLIT
jgi:hypothetical protein